MPEAVVRLKCAECGKAFWFSAYDAESLSEGDPEDSDWLCRECARRLLNEDQPNPVAKITCVECKEEFWVKEDEYDDEYDWLCDKCSERALNKSQCQKSDTSTGSILMSI